MPSPSPLTVFCTVARGGIADYTHAQCLALTSAGVNVALLCPEDFVHSSNAYTQIRSLAPIPQGRVSRLRSRWRLARKILHDQLFLDRHLREARPGHLLLASYIEYLAPLWAWRLRDFGNSGLRIGAMLHDPVRDHQVGPAWWHRWSVREGYSFLNHVFVHDPMPIETPGARPDLKTSVVPHGPLRLPPVSVARSAVRADLDIPEHATVFLSFGHLRDNKNLHLVLEAMAEVADAWLLVAGSEASSGQTDSARYRARAEGLQVAPRCRWIIRFLPGDEAANLFAASDFILLTYSSGFRSASGVLNVAGQFGKPLLVSAGPSNLVSVTERYGLGLTVAPDSASAIADGMRRMIAHQPNTGWPTYSKDHSWEANAKAVWSALSDSTPIPA
ncbi:MAG: glycosyltransferase [Verrucomicrobiales bacterium]